jgi:hypothetical protein
MSPSFLTISVKLIRSDEAIVEIAGSGIPDHVRESISRLVENQVLEAEEQERVLAEARGEPVRPRDRARVYDDVDHDEEDISRVKIVGEGDASGDEDIEGDSDKVVDVSHTSSLMLGGLKLKLCRKHVNHQKKQFMTRTYRSNWN